MGHKKKRQGKRGEKKKEEGRGEQWRGRREERDAMNGWESRTRRAIRG